MSFHEEAVTPGCLRLLEFLRHEPVMADFYLAGGTALALQIGHRVSTDLDWFSTNRTLLGPEREAVRAALAGRAGLDVVSEQDGVNYPALKGEGLQPRRSHWPFERVRHGTPTGR